MRRVRESAASRSACFDTPVSRRTAAAATPPLFARSRPLRWLLRLPARLGHDPADPSDVRVHKAFLVAV